MDKELIQIDRELASQRASIYKTIREVDGVTKKLLSFFHINDYSEWPKKSAKPF